MFTACFYVDVFVYFVVGVLLILYSQRPTEDENESKHKLYVQAVVVGLLLAACRYGVHFFMGQTTLKKVQDMFNIESCPAVQKIADIISA